MHRSPTAMLVWIATGVRYDVYVKVGAELGRSSVGRVGALLDRIAGEMTGALDAIAQKGP
mgnify:CR=1 FL=1